MKSRAARLASIFVIFAGFEAPALAYLDGATGSILLQAAIGLLASWMVYYRMFKEKARELVGRLSGRPKVGLDGE